MKTKTLAYILVTSTNKYVGIDEQLYQPKQTSRIFSAFPFENRQEAANYNKRCGLECDIKKLVLAD